MSYTTEVVVYQNGKPSSGHRVSLGFNGLFNSGMTKDYSTDSSGTAHIQHELKGDANVYIDGNHSNHGTTLNTPGRVTVYL
jgi:hypothetical protein